MALYKLLILALVSVIFLTACAKSKPVIPEDWTTYNSEKFGFEISHPKLYTLEETENGINIYHFREQPVSYFSVTVSAQNTDDILKSWNAKILKDEVAEKAGLTGRLILTEDEKSKTTLDTYFFSSDNKTYYFSCHGQTYEEICNTFQIID